MSYSVYEFYTQDEIERDWLISILSDYHFEGFEETSASLNAFVRSEKMNQEMVEDILSQNEFSHLKFSTSELENKNWNEEWEKNFEPVLIANNVAIRAPFHSPQKAKIEIVIEPKMSFGTGHHATTASMVELMLDLDIKGKKVLDFGCGTGILSILASKLGAMKVAALDNEEWAFKNCVENVERNHCANVYVYQGDDTFTFKEKFDVILANVNRHVILKNIAKWGNLLNPGSVLMVSGILLSDEQDVMFEAVKNSFVLRSILKNNGWLAIAFHTES